MTFQKRLLRAMRRHNMRVADLARHFEVPYTTVREWVVFGRTPYTNNSTAQTYMQDTLRRLKKLE